MFTATNLHMVALSQVSFCNPGVGTEKSRGWNAEAHGFSGRGWWKGRGVRKL